MSIVSSIIESTSLQKDGRRWIHEIHTDQVGLKYDRNYLTPAGADANAALAAYAIQLATDIQNAEINNNVGQVIALGSLASPKLVYSTAAQNFAALRTAYLTATQTQAIMIGDFLSSLTNAQLQTAFGMTANQVTTLRTNKLQPAANAAATIRATTGQ